MPNLCIIPARALINDTLTDVDIRVLCAIGLHTDQAGEGCWAKVKTLCLEAGKIGRSTFFASTRRLLDAGLIERDSGQASGNGSTYRILLDKPRGCPASGTGGGVQPARHPPSSQQDSPVHRAGRDYY